MRRSIMAALAGAIFVAALLAQGDLPKPDESAGLEIEPPLLIQGRDRDGMPILPASAQSVDLTKLENDLARAVKNAASGERLYRAGIIAKVEAEERALKVVRLQANLATARLEEAKSKAEEEKAAADVSNAKPNESGLAQAEQAAQHALEERLRAELESALRNLQRQQKLLALGSGRKADVNRAEKKLAELQDGEN